MIATKDIWMTLTADGKAREMEEALTQLHFIDTGRHPLSLRADQGRLAGVKKDLERFIVQALGWESDRPSHRS